MELSSLTPDQLRALKAQLDGLTDTSGRSPNRPRQLHDLRLLPTATDPRPTFFWSAESPRDLPPQPCQPYPRLMWHLETGQEITVHDAAEERAHLDAYGHQPPADLPVPTAMESLEAALAALTDDERAAVLNAQKKERMDAITAKLASLPPEALDKLLASAQDSTAKRGPGRPRKVAV